MNPFRNLEVPVGLNDNDAFSIEWVSAREAGFCWSAIISVECYGSVFQPETEKILVALGELKSRISLSLGNSDVYLPLENWRQVVVADLQAMQEFLIHILTTEIGKDSDEALDIAIQFTEALEEGCHIRPINPRHN